MSRRLRESIREAGAAVSGMFPYTRSMYSESDAQDWFKKWEGDIEHMYLDTVGVVTVGVGAALFAASDATALAFVVRAGGAAATAAQITTDYDEVKKQTKGQIASTYKQYTKCDLPQAKRDELLLAKIRGFDARLKARRGLLRRASGSTPCPQRHSHIAAVLTHLERLAFRAPVRQHDALALAARQVQQVHGRTVRVAVNQTGDVERLHLVRNRCVDDVGDRRCGGSGGFVPGALATPAVRNPAPDEQGQTQHAALPLRGARARPEGLVHRVGGAIAVAMREQRADATQHHHCGVVQQLHPAALSEFAGHHEVAVAVHEIDRHAGIDHGFQRLRDLLIEGRAVVVADPGLEHIAEQVERLCLPRPSRKEGQQDGGQVRPGFVEMQIGDEQRGHATVRQARWHIMAVRCCAGTGTAYAATVASSIRRIR